jgi:hypothetical protein
VSKNKGPFRWPFAKWRQQWIAEGDRLVAQAEEVKNEGLVRRSRYEAAAKLYIKSAGFYRRAGLGLCAATSYQDAADCYSVLGDDTGCKSCEEKAEAIPVYYEEAV